VIRRFLDAFVVHGSEVLLFSDLKMEYKLPLLPHLVERIQRDLLADLLAFIFSNHHLSRVLKATDFRIFFQERGIEASTKVVASALRKCGFVYARRKVWTALTEKPDFVKKRLDFAKWLRCVPDDTLLVYLDESYVYWLHGQTYLWSLPSNLETKILSRVGLRGERLIMISAITNHQNMDNIRTLDFSVTEIWK